ncbi:MAG: DNA-3-methyladenine glycosylase I [Phycisphaera sp.]|nr:DNA-3-methyladenine glycosylase I [Phycisphaera sp.]
MPRCAWAKTDLSIPYHDNEWGVPSHDDAHLFEMIILEGAQAGLSWETILKKRDNYRAALHGFDVERIARYTARDRDRLLADAGIVRNRMKIDATIANAKATLKARDAFGSLDACVWRFVDGEPIVHRYRKMSELPAQTPESKAMSKDLLSRGFKFVGPTICYAFMQAVGMVNDHLVSCPRRAELA